MDDDDTTDKFDWIYFLSEMMYNSWYLDKLLNFVSVKNPEQIPRMDLTGTKAIVLVLLGMIKLVSGLAPLVFTKIFKRRSERFLKKFIGEFIIIFNWVLFYLLFVCTGIVLCFGGGVLLSTVFIHMMKEVRESLERATTMGMIPVEMEFPFAELLICMGKCVYICCNS